jgi:nitrate reductase NapE component
MYDPIFRFAELAQVLLAVLVVSLVAGSGYIAWMFHLFLRKWLVSLS